MKKSSLRNFVAAVTANFEEKGARPNFTILKGSDSGYSAEYVLIDEGLYVHPEIDWPNLAVEGVEIADIYAEPVNSCTLALYSA